MNTMHVMKEANRHKHARLIYDLNRKINMTVLDLIKLDKSDEMKKLLAEFFKQHAISMYDLLSDTSVAEKESYEHAVMR